ncbi:MAG: hypothetical protein ABIM88_01095 [candidate division WOR-3 bacterium]
MKRIFLLLGLVGLLWAAQRSVLVEAFSSTTCPHCPFSNAACEWLARDFSDTVSVIQYMQGLSGSDATYRFNFYGVSGVPDVWFTGIDRELGSTDDTTGDYNRYKNRVNNWKWVVSPIIIDAGATCTSTSGIVECLIKIETTLPPTAPDPRVFCVITERHVFGDGRYNRFIMRDIISKPTGDSLLVSQAGDTQRFVWTFNISGWNPESLDATIFVQSYQTHLVHQSKQIKVVYGSGAHEDTPKAPGFDIWLSSGTLYLNIPSETWVKIDAYDPAGRAERELVSGRLSAGEHGFSLSGLGKGVHILVARTGFGTKTAKLIE